MGASKEAPGDSWENLPVIPEDLLLELERRHVHYVPSLDTPDRKIWYELGRRSYVVWLRRVFEHQRRNKPNVYQ